MSRALFLCRIGIVARRRVAAASPCSSFASAPPAVWGVHFGTAPFNRKSRLSIAGRKPRDAPLRTSHPAKSLLFGAKEKSCSVCLRRTCVAETKRKAFRRARPWNPQFSFAALFLSSEIRDSAGKQRIVLHTGNVFVQPPQHAFRMSHAAHDAAIGRRERLHRA